MFGFGNSKPPAKTMTAVEAHYLAAKGSIHLVDVREAGEWNDAHVPGAIHAPLSTLPDLLSSLPDDKPVVFYCLSGKRSATAVAMSQKLGLRHDTHVLGGIKEWIASGLPVER